MILVLMVKLTVVYRVNLVTVARWLLLIALLASCDRHLVIITADVKVARRVFLPLTIHHLAFFVPDFPVYS